MEGPRPLVSDAAIRESIADGQSRAESAFARAHRPTTFAGPPQGFLLAEGDSWFDYPMYEDVAEALENVHGYKLRSAAHHGDTVTAMAYDPSQIRRLTQLFEDMKD